MVKKTDKEVKPKETKVKNPLEGFIDISDRYVMIYVLANGTRLEVYDPKLLKVCESGAHKIIDKENMGMYIHPEKSYYIHWSMKDGTNPYTF